MIIELISRLLMESVLLVKHQNIEKYEHLSDNTRFAQYTSYIEKGRSNGSIELH